MKSGFKKELLLCLLTVSSFILQAFGGVVEKSGVKGGLAVYIGKPDAELILSLHPDEKYIVHALLNSKDSAVALRKQFLDKGVYGKVSVHPMPADGKLPYVDDSVNLLVVNSPSTGFPQEELMRVLTPRGALMIKNSEGSWVKTVKPWPDDIDEWTHSIGYDSGNNMVSKDKRIGPPRHIQWVSGPLFQRHHGMHPSYNACASAGGRMFYIGEEVPMGVSGIPGKWYLFARDGFNGVLLWKYRLKNWGPEVWSYWTASHLSRTNQPIHLRKRLVAEGDKVYTTLGFNAPVSQLDAATGKIIQTYKGTDYTNEIVYREGILYLSVNDRPQKPFGPAEGMDFKGGIVPTVPKNPVYSKKKIWAVNASDGKVLWKSEKSYSGRSSKLDRLASMQNINLTVGGKGVFFVTGSNLVGIDLETGKELWRKPRPNAPGKPERSTDPNKYFSFLNTPDMMNMIYYDGLVFLLYTSGPSKRSAAANVMAINPENGDELWKYTFNPVSCNNAPDMWGRDGMIWIIKDIKTGFTALDCKTGKEVKSLKTDVFLKAGHHHRCYPNKMTANYILTARRGAEYFNINSGSFSGNNWARSACRIGHLLANGFTYKFPDPCNCFAGSEPRGMYAYAAESAGKKVVFPPKGSELLEKGPAYGKISSTPSGNLNSEWATYRHDPMRSGSTPATIPDKLEKAWDVPIGKKLTAPVIAGGKVYVACRDKHTVYALDLKTGKILWSYTADGPIDTPPTVSKGRVIFGSHDGFLYCLRDSDGQLAWRLQLAPDNRLINAFGYVESPWPVNGSLLITGNTVFCYAGRSSVIDGGIAVYAVNADTGEVLEKRVIHDDQKTINEKVGILADILETDGKSVIMRKTNLEFKTPVKLDDSYKPLASLGIVIAPSTGFLNDFWFHRVFWSAGRKMGFAVMIVYDMDCMTTVNLLDPSIKVKTNVVFYCPTGSNPSGIIKYDKSISNRWFLSGVYPQIGGIVLATYTNKSLGFVPGSPQPEPVQASGPKIKVKKKKKSSASKTLNPEWIKEHFPMYPRAIMLTSDKLITGGFHDKINQEDPWAAFEGRSNGVLTLLNKVSGTKIAEYTLDTPPEWDGMAVVDGHLVICLKNGSIICMH